MKMTNKMSKIRPVQMLLLAVIMVVSSLMISPATAEAAAKKTGKVTSVKLNHSNYTLKKGRKVKLKATVNPASAARKVTLKWSSSKQKVATVSSKGVVKGIKKGTAIITVKVKGTGIKAKCTVRVGTPVKRVTVNKSKLTLKPGETQTIRTTVTPKSAAYKKVSYTSSAPKVAGVSSKGEITAREVGTATITVKATDGSGRKANVNVIVEAVKVTGITVSAAKTTLTAGETTTATAIVTPSNATNRSVTWSSSNTSVAKVDAKGEITALSVGTAAIKATAKDGSGREASVKITVEAVKVTGITVSAAKTTLAAGRTTTATAIVTPSNATDKSVTWSSSDASVAQVDDEGKITALSVGTVTVKATANDGSNQYGSVEITVKATLVETLLEGYTPIEGLNQDTPHILSMQEFDTPSPHVRVSGCFGDGTAAQFNIYLPPIEQWEGRFFQRTHPQFGLDAVTTDLAFDLDSGAYSITIPAGAMGHIKQASAAHVSRTIAKNYYDYDEKIYGYLEGGSGGSMQTIGAIEASTGSVWDGAVPFIVAEPASLGNFDIRWFARAVLEDKAPLIADAVSPGGSGDPYAALTDMESDVLREVTKLGIPLEAWENYEYLFSTSSYPDLIRGLNSTGGVNAAYTNAFWNEPGYLESYDSELRDLFYSLKARGVSEGALAKIAYHRHKDPGETFYTWSHLRNAAGDPLYAQTTGTHYAIETALNVAGGSGWTGEINCKTIMVVNLLDLDSFPSDGDYYYQRVKAMGLEDDCRIWLNENANHHASNSVKRLIDYTGVLEQALLDLSAWVEDGVEPPNSSSYSMVDSQIILEENAAVRGGIQPAVELSVNDALRANITSGGSVNLSARIQVPQGTGEIVSVEWDFLGNGTFVKADFDVLPDGSWEVNASYTYNKGGTYFPQVRVASRRDGETDTTFARAYNLGRARVIVGE